MHIRLHRIFAIYIFETGSSQVAEEVFRVRLVRGWQLVLILLGQVHLVLLPTHLVLLVAVVERLLRLVVVHGLRGKKSA